jgi:hypothetical protein
MIGEGRLTLDQIPSIIPFVMNRHVMSAPLSLSLCLRRQERHRQVSPSRMIIRIITTSDTAYTPTMIVMDKISTGAFRCRLSAALLEG